MEVKEILNELEVNMENLEKDGYHFSFIKIKDALKEIEELKKRKCSNCKFWMQNENDKYNNHPNWRECKNEKSPTTYFQDCEHTFYCNKWESN